MSIRCFSMFQPVFVYPRTQDMGCKPANMGDLASVIWIQIYPLLISVKHTKNYGKLPFLIGKSTINGHFQ